MHAFRASSVAHGVIESICQPRGHGFNPWSRKSPLAAEQLRPCAVTTEPLLYSLGAAIPEPTYLSCRSLHTLKPVLNKRSQHDEKPSHGN